MQRGRNIGQDVERQNRHVGVTQFHVGKFALDGETCSLSLDGAALGTDRSLASADDASFAAISACFPENAPDATATFEDSRSRSIRLFMVGRL